MSSVHQVILDCDLPQKIYNRSVICLADKFCGGLSSVCDLEDKKIVNNELWIHSDFGSYGDLCNGV